MHESPMYEMCNLTICRVISCNVLGKIGQLVSCTVLLSDPIVAVGKLDNLVDQMFRREETVFRKA